MRVLYLLLCVQRHNEVTDTAVKPIGQLQRQLLLTVYESLIISVKILLRLSGLLLSLRRKALLCSSDAAAQTSDVMLGFELGMKYNRAMLARRKIINNNPARYPSVLA